MNHLKFILAMPCSTYAIAIYFTVCCWVAFHGKVRYRIVVSVCCYFLEAG